MRVALGVEYDGSRFHGWQSQPKLNTVQGNLEQAIQKIVNYKDVSVTCAGRTDTGVHAVAQVVHFDCHVNRSPNAFIYGVNSKLPKDISVRWSKVVNEEFNARFSALSRSYRYIICNHPIKPAHLCGQMSWYYKQLNEQLMHEAAQYMIGENDFSSFRSSECQSKTPMRRIDAISVKRYEHFIFIDITANAFLHHMVRNIVGVLLAVGTERKEIGWVSQLLKEKDRTKAAETAPPYGLYLSDVQYPEEFDLPKVQITNPLLMFSK